MSSAIPIFVVSLYNQLSLSYKLKISNMGMFSISLFIIVCVKNGYPKGLKSNCKRSYSCVLLAKRKMCGKKYSKAMSRGCNAQITPWFQNQLVRNFCKLSCNKCTRKYYTQCSILRNQIALFSSFKF